MSATQQPKWKFLANLGDVSPIDHGGYFVFTDETGVYPPEAILLTDNGENEYGEPTSWTVYRFILEKCTYVNGILSDNQFHPECSAWFAGSEEERAKRPQDTTYLRNVASYCDNNEQYLIRLFCSDDPLDRAAAYRMVGDYHGFNNLDHDPLEFTSRGELKKWLKGRGINTK